MSREINQLCPVCGYELGFDPWNDASSSDEICPSCGIQFGYDDAAGGSMIAREGVYRGWRRSWVERGCPWSSIGLSPPVGWNPREQMRAAGVEPE